MSSSSSKDKEESSKSSQDDDKIQALFQDVNDTSLAEGFRDKVRAIHECMDRDGDGFLNFVELSALQYCTSQTTLDAKQYEMTCRCLDCHPTRGISLDALRLVYASEGTNLDEDYEAILKAVRQSKTNDDNNNNNKKEEEEVVYEAGVDGYDIT